MDEVMFAGGFSSYDTNLFWLCTNQDYWTMSPYVYSSSHGYAIVLGVSFDGHLTNYFVDGTHGVRPVINLRADTELIGNGTTSAPYVVVS